MYIAICGTVAVNPTTKGHTFYTGYISLPIDEQEFKLRVLTLSKDPVVFNVSSSKGFNCSGGTTFNNSALVDIPASFEVLDYTYEYRNLGLIIESSPFEPIFVLGIILLYNDPFTTFEVHPYIEQPTKEFVYYGISFGKAGWMGDVSQLLLVGCEDNTRVKIKPSGDITLNKNLQEQTTNITTIQDGDLYSVLINKLQTLILHNQDDITGTKIVSNKPLTVISGHSCTKIPRSINHHYCDAITTQVPPTINWGKTFILPPLSARKNGQRYKIIASENNTKIDLQCSDNTSPNTQFIDEGEVYRFDTGYNEYCSIVTSKPCYIAEVSFSREYRNENYGDPLMLSVPPLEQYAKGDVVISPLVDKTDNFFTIIIPYLHHTGDFLLNKRIVSPSNWITVEYPNCSIAGYGYSARLNETVTISLVNTTGKFLVVVYGFQSDRGFGYTPNMEFNPINSPPVYIRFVSPVYHALEESEKVVVSIEKESSTFIGDVSVKVRTKKFAIATAKGRLNIYRYVS